MPVGALADRRAVAQQLRDLAEQPGLAARRDELVSLADALQGIGDGDVEPWTELDLLQAYARPESVTALGSGDPRPRYLAWLETAIGALVFVPLLLTWFGLVKASSAYEALIATDPRAAGRPFLQLWQSGFEGRLTGSSTFGSVAQSATLTIAALLVLAVVHGWRRAVVDRGEEAAQRAADALLARLVPVLTRAQLLLNEERLTSPQRFTAELTAAAKTLRELGDKAIRAQKQLAGAAATVGDAVEGAERRLAGVDSAVRPLEESASDIGKTLEKVGDRVETAVTGTGVMVRQALEDVRTASTEVRDTLGRAGDRVEDSVHTLAAAQRSFTTGAEVSADVSARLLDRLSDVVEETGAGIHRLDDRTDALRQAAERFAELAAELGRAHLAGGPQTTPHSGAAVVPGSGTLPGSAGPGPAVPPGSASATATGAGPATGAGLASGTGPASGVAASASAPDAVCDTPVESV